MNILEEFYKECESKYQDIKNIPDEYYKNKAEKRLQVAPLKALPQLRKLCGEDEKMMFAILQAFLLIPLSFEVHEIEANLQREKTIEKDRKKRKLVKEVENITKKHASTVLDFLPDTDEKTLIDGARNRLRTDKIFKAKLEDLNETVKKHEKGKKDWHGKSVLHFKNIIYETFLMSKEKTDLPNNAIYNYIAKFLDSLTIRNTKGKPFTPDNIKYHCKTSSR